MIHAGAKAIHPTMDFLTALEEVIADRKNNPSDKSYVASLFAKGINKIAQKGRGGSRETVIEAKDTNWICF